MPKELVAIAPKRLVLREYEEPHLKPDDVQIKSLLSAEKHGTTMAVYTGVSPFSKKTYNSKSGLFVPKKTDTARQSLFPRSLGNMTVGTVTETGKQVEKFKVGDRAYGYLPIKETHSVNEKAVNLAPAELSNEDLVCIDPAVVAFMAVREGRVKLGDSVAIFGLGAVGLMAVQLAKLAGALTVMGVELIKKRKDLAEAYGANVVLDPSECDVGFEVKKVTGGHGVDVSIDASGSYRALHEAIRATRYGGIVVPVSWYHGEAKGLNLGEEWHFNRQIMVSGARVESEPYTDHPLWDRKRVYETVMKLFQTKRLTSKDLLCPIVKLADAVEAYKVLVEKPEETIKLGVKYS